MDILNHQIALTDRLVVENKTIGAKCFAIGVAGYHSRTLNFIGVFPTEFHIVHFSR